MVLRSSARRGFTLIELLVTMAILIVLAALVFVVSSRSIAKAHSASDLADLRNHGLALAAVAAADGRFPLSEEGLGQRRYWMDRIRADRGGPSTLRDTYTLRDVAPFLSRRVNTRISADTGQSDLRRLKHYAAVEAVLPWRQDAGNSPYTGVPVMAVKRPAELIMLVDAQGKEELENCHINLWGDYRSRWFLGETWPKADSSRYANQIVPEASGAIDYRHDGRAHAVFVDGHVEALRPAEVRFRNFTNAY